MSADPRPLHLRGWWSVHPDDTHKFTPETLAAMNEALRRNTEEGKLIVTINDVTLTYHEAPNPDPLDSLEGYWEKAYWRVVPKLAEALVQNNQAPNPDPLYVPEPQYATIRDRPGITIPLLLAIVVVVAVVLAVAWWTR